MRYITFPLINKIITGICIIFILIAANSLPLYPQFENGMDEIRTGVGFGMGISSINIPDMVDYINFISPASPENRLSEFNNSVEFFVAFNRKISTSLYMGFEYAFLLNSHNTAGGEFGYNMHLPIITGHYVVIENVYQIKIGGGLGYYFTRFNEKFPFDLDRNRFDGGGVHGKIQVVGYTPLSVSTYGYVGLDLRLAGESTMKDSEDKVLEYVGGKVSMRFFAVGVKLGLLLSL